MNQFKKSENGEVSVFGYMEHLYSDRDIAKACKTDKICFRLTF